MPTITGSCDNSRYSLTCEYSFTQNITANTSTITANVYLNGNGYTTSSSYWTCVINGVTVTSNKSASIGGKTLLGSRTWTVNHNSDGTCQTTISFSYGNGLVSAGTYTTKAGSGSSNIALTTIPRGSSITLNRTTATLGIDAVTITLNRASANYTHKVQLYFGSYSALLAENVGTSYTFTPNISLCSQIPNTTSGTATIKIQTMNGSSWVAETSKTITFNVPSTVVPTIESVTATGKNLLGGVYVAGKSSVTAKINGASGAYGSTIKSYSISGAKISVLTASGSSPILDAGTYTITGKVTDSRGRSSSKTTTITVCSYYEPSLNIDFYRCNADGEKNDSGVYAKVDIDHKIQNIGNANINAKQYKIEYKKAASTTWTTLKGWTDIADYNALWSCDLGGDWDVSVTYNLRVYIKDSYNTVLASAAIGTLSCLLNIEKDGIGIGKTHESGALDVAGAIYATDCLSLKGENTDNSAALSPGSLELRTLVPGDVGTSGLTVDMFDNQFRLRIKGTGKASKQGLSVQGPGDTMLMNIDNNGSVRANKFVIPALFGTNFISSGTGDGNDYTTYNVKFHTHNGLAFTDNGGNATVIVQGRQGRIMGKNAYYVNSSKILKSDIRSVLSEHETNVINLNETIDEFLTTELICDFLDNISVRTYVTDFEQKGVTQEEANPKEGHSLNLGYIADELSEHQAFKYIGEKTDDGLFAINSNALTTALISAYQTEKKARLELERRLTEIESYLKKTF